MSSGSSMWRHWLQGSYVAGNSKSTTYSSHLWLLLPLESSRMEKMQALGLQAAYNSDNNTYKFIHKLLSLPYLPAEHISTIFRKLQHKAVTKPLQELTTYIETTWLNNSLWTTTSWSVFNHITRTNNDVEGWHHHMNKKPRKDNFHSTCYSIYFMMKPSKSVYKYALLLKTSWSIESNKSTKWCSHQCISTCRIIQLAPRQLPIFWEHAQTSFMFPTDWPSQHQHYQPSPFQDYTSTKRK